MKNVFDFKQLLLTAALTAMPIFGIAGGMDGGGGFTLACPNANFPKMGALGDYVESSLRYYKTTPAETILDLKAHIDFKIYDLYTGVVNGVPTYAKVNLGAPGLSVKDKIDIALTRLQRLDPHRANMYKMLVTEFLTNTYGEVDYKSGEKPTPYIKDMGPGNIPNDCELYLTISQVDPDPDLGEKRYTVTREFWETLDSENRATLILHEIIYREAGLAEGAGSSKYVQQFVRLLVTGDFEKFTRFDYVKLVKKLGLPFVSIQGNVIADPSTIMLNYFDTRMQTWHDNWPSKNRVPYADIFQDGMDYFQFHKLGDRGQIFLRYLGFKPYTHDSKTAEKFNSSHVEPVLKNINRPLYEWVEKNWALKFEYEGAPNYYFGSSNLRQNTIAIPLDSDMKWDTNGPQIDSLLINADHVSILGFEVIYRGLYVSVNESDDYTEFSLLKESDHTFNPALFNKGSKQIACDLNKTTKIILEHQTGKTTLTCDDKKLESQIPVTSRK